MRRSVYLFTGMRGQGGKAACVASHTEYRKRQRRAVEIAAHHERRMLGGEEAPGGRKGKDRGVEADDPPHDDVHRRADHDSGTAVYKYHMTDRKGGF